MQNNQPRLQIRENKAYNMKMKDPAFSGPSGILYEPPSILNSSKEYRDHLEKGSNCRGIRSARQPSLPCRPGSPTNRNSYNIRCELDHWRNNDCLRKSKSIPLPCTNPHDAKIWHSKFTCTMSNPDLMDKQFYEIQNLAEKAETDPALAARRRFDRMAILYENTRWLCIIFNIVIVILSLLYLGGGAVFIISKDILLSAMDYRSYALLMLYVYGVSFCFILVAAYGFVVLWKMNRQIRMHAGLTFIFSILMGSMIFFQNLLQTRIEVSLESRLKSSMSFNDSEQSEAVWDFFHDSFKCCGVTGYLDWCYQTDIYSQFRAKQPPGFSGTYVCSIPRSCCKILGDDKNDDPSMSVNRANCADDHSQLNEINNSGCLSFIKREIYQVGLLYKMIIVVSIGTLITLSFLSTSLFVYFKK